MYDYRVVLLILNCDLLKIEVEMVAPLFLVKLSAFNGTGTLSFVFSFASRSLVKMPLLVSVSGMISVG